MDLKPRRKVVAATLGAALGTILVWVIKAASAVEIPEGVSLAIAVVMTFIVGYMVPEE